PTTIPRLRLSTLYPYTTLFRSLYERAMEAEPRRVEAYSEAAFAYLQRRENQRAVAIAERAVAIDDADSRAWITLGAAHQALGNRSEAFSAYQSCVAKGRGRYVPDCQLMLREALHGRGVANTHLS